ncbi:2-amino-4-hydroxy-6-hydroxymethyldihydropteridine diphosphokinase [Rothia sp. LK2588]|uniref:2-amino-4-hydroxy-6- hydroxymethyldihydropteridine diphosphokinase n=1 Tax=Rothia sp. LK2588 TaxID=3114369 RepID=UPI0034CD1F93
MTVSAILALGSNLGAREETLLRAIGDLAHHPKIRVLKTSPMAITEAVGGPENQPNFINLVVQIETELGPFDLLRYCQQVELKHHRTREVHWGPRTLDIDIIAYGDLEMDEPDLSLPHPMAAQRAFVLAPWAKMDPQATLEDELVSVLAQEANDVDGILEYRPAPVVCA